MFRISNTSIFLMALAMSLTHVWTCNAADNSAGASLYDENCAACHQADAIGQAGVAPSLTNRDLLSIVSDDFLYQAIADGRPGTSMPAWGKDLSKEEITAIVAFLRSHESLPNRAREVNAAPEAAGDRALGNVWFHEVCSTCHGVNGEGYEAGGSGTAIGLPGFLSNVSDGFLRETIRNGRSNTRMLSFTGTAGLANLSNEQVEDIISYLRSL